MSISCTLFGVKKPRQTKRSCIESEWIKALSLTALTQNCNFHIFQNDKGWAESHFHFQTKNKCFRMFSHLIYLVFVRMKTQIFYDRRKTHTLQFLTIIIIHLFTPAEWYSCKVKLLGINNLLFLILIFFTSKLNEIQIQLLKKRRVKQSRVLYMCI